MPRLRGELTIRSGVLVGPGVRSGSAQRRRRHSRLAGARSRDGGEHRVRPRTSRGFRAGADRRLDAGRTRVGPARRKCGPDGVPRRGGGPRLGAGDPRLHGRPAHVRPGPAALGRAHPGSARGRYLAARLGPVSRGRSAPNRHEPARTHRPRGRCGAQGGERPAPCPRRPLSRRAARPALLPPSPGQGRCADHLVDAGRVRFERRWVRGVAACLRRGTAGRCPGQHSGPARRGPGRGVVADALVRGADSWSC